MEIFIWELKWAVRECGSYHEAVVVNLVASPVDKVTREGTRAFEKASRINLSNHTTAPHALIIANPSSYEIFVLIKHLIELLLLFLFLPPILSFKIFNLIAFETSGHVI